MKISIRSLKKIINEVNYLEDTHNLSTDSVDEQIDTMFVAFEKHSTGEDEYGIEDPGEISEGPEDQVEEPDPQALAGGGEDEATVDPQAELESEPEPESELDAGRFAVKLARLVKNRDKLLDVRIVIINRAMGYLTENHGPETAKAVADKLKTVHNIVPNDDHTEEHQPPPGQGAEGIPGGV